MVADAKVKRGELLLQFSFPVDPASIEREGAVSGELWNYRWSSAYGSDQYSPTTGERGVDPLRIQKLVLEKEGTVLRIYAQELRPVDQLHLTLRLKARDGDPFEEDLYWTIHAIPEEVGKD
jgi:hypothetical protein